MCASKERASGVLASAQARYGTRAVEVTLVTVVLLVAAVIRVVYLLQYKSNAPYYSALLVDSYYYDMLARRIADGQGYGAAPFYTGPLYPYTLALVYKVVGHAPRVIYVLQSLLGVLNLFFVYLLGRRLYGMKYGIAAMIMLALYAPLMYLESKILTETFAVALNLASILLLMRAIDRPGIGGYVLAGLVMGLSVLCRPVGLITIVLILGWLSISAIRPGRMNAGVGHIAALTAGILLVILPVTARNLIVGRDFALISTNGGVNFAQGNNQHSQGVFTALPGFSGSIRTQQQEEMALASKALGRQVKASESSSYWLKQGLRFTVEHPVQSAWLTVRKAVWSLHNREAACNYNVYLEKMLVPTLRLLFMPFFLLAGLALFGYMLTRSDGLKDAAKPVTLYALSVLLSLVAFSVTSRFRVPVAPALAVFAGYGLVKAVESIGDKRLLTRLVASVLLVLVLSAVPYPVPAIAAQSYANLGNSCLARDDSDGAILYLTKALETDPGNADVHNKLGNAYAQIGRLGDAEEHFRAAVQLKPLFAEAHNNLGNTLLAEKDMRGALDSYLKALALNPKYPEAHYNIGNILAGYGKTGEAVTHYRQAIALKPDYAQAYFNLSVALFYQNKYTEAWSAIAQCRKYGFTPDPRFIAALTAKSRGR